MYFPIFLTWQAPLDETAVSLPFTISKQNTQDARWCCRPVTPTVAASLGPILSPSILQRKRLL